VRGPPVLHDRDRHGKLDAAEGLERIDHRTEAPGMHLILECLLKPPEPFAVFRHRLHIFWEDDLLSGRGTDNLTEPAQVGWAPRVAWPV
jgi:hypothetical protein